MAEPTTEFLSRFRSMIKSKIKDGDLSEEDVMSIYRSARGYAGGMGKKKKRDAEMTAGEKSYNDVIDAVNNALREQFKVGNGDNRFWAKEVYAGYAIVHEWMTNKCFRVPYMIDNDKITFGEFTEVEETYVPVEMADMCANGKPFRLFIESSFSAPPEWMPLLPKPGEYKHPEYGKIKITKERNEAFINNFKSAAYQSKLPINAEHKPNEEGALGWIVDMRLNDDESVDAKASWTDLGNEAIENDRFAYVSPEWFDSWTDNHGTKHKDIVSGAALTVRPFFKDSSMRPLVASERGLFLCDQNDNFDSQLLFFTAATPINKEVEMAEDKKPDDGVSSPDSAKQFAEMKAGLETVQAENAALKTANEQLTESLKQAGERLSKMELDARTSRFTALSACWFGDKAKHVKLLESLGEGSEAYNDYVAQQNAIAEAMKQSKIFDEIGSDHSGSNEQTATAKLEAKAKEIKAAEPALTYEQAYAKACEQNPAIYNEHVAESRKGVN